MTKAEALRDLEKAASAAGYAMASADDDAQLNSAPLAGDAVARGGHVPTVKAALAALPPAARHAGHAEHPRSIIPSAHTVRDTVYGYLGISATA